MTVHVKTYDVSVYAPAPAPAPGFCDDHLVAMDVGGAR